jgi:hypothetical protein
MSSIKAQTILRIVSLSQPSNLQVPLSSRPTSTTDPADSLLLCSIVLRLPPLSLADSFGTDRPLLLLWFLCF